MSPDFSCLPLIAYHSDHFSQKFCTLKQELLTVTSRLEASANLAQELCTACRKYFIIKRMFWEVRVILARNRSTPVLAYKLSAAYLY